MFEIVELKKHFQFAVCWNGLQNDRDCPPGLHYSYFDNDCVDPFLADCNLDYHLCEESRRTGLPTFHKNSRDCESYFLCVDSKAISLNCEPGFHFDERKNWCSDPETVQCKVSEKRNVGKLFDIDALL
jgi:Chitin binding Peritrophin-A domain